MKQWNRVDANGLYIEPMLLNDGEILTEPVTDADGNVTYQPRTDLISTPVPEGFHQPKWDGSQWVEGKSQDDLMTLAKSAKINEIQAAAGEHMETFISSALGTPHTYLTGYGKGNTDFLMLETEDRYMQSADYDGQPILWYTIEAGDVEHTKDQLHQVYLEGRSSGQAVKMHAKNLIGQISVCTSFETVNAFNWNSPDV